MLLGVFSSDFLENRGPRGKKDHITSWITGITSYVRSVEAAQLLSLGHVIKWI